MTKKCTKCGVDQNLSEFYKDSSRKDGIRPICRTCTLTQHKEYRNDPVKKEKRKQNQEKYKSTIHSKLCVKCNILKSISEFYSGVNTKDGLDTKCKECTLKYVTEYRNENKEIIINKHRVFYNKNKDEINSKRKIKRSENIDKIIESGIEKYNNSISKICSACGLKKDKSDFFIKYDSSDGLHPFCKTCNSEISKKYREQNKEKLSEYHKTYYNNNKETINKNSSIYNKKNKKHLNNKNRERSKKRREKDYNYKISINLRNRVYYAITKKYNITKSNPNIILLGCTIDECRQYLESQFLPGMSWENHGIHGWHIDHIIPCASFDLTDPEQQKKCFHYTNLQPLWAKDNIKKGCKINYQK